MRKEIKILDCGTCDRRRANMLPLLVIIAVILFSTSCLGVLYGSTASFLYFFIAMVVGVFAVSLFPVRACVRKGRRLWRDAGYGVVLEVPRRVVLCELAPWLLMVLLVPAYIVLVYLTGFSVIGVACGIAEIWALVHVVPIFVSGGPVAEQLVLDAEGVCFTRISGERTFMSWSQKPVVVGVDSGYLIVGARGAEESTRFSFVRLPVDYLSLSCCQVERLLEAFSCNPALRGRLDDPDALQVVLGILEPTEEEYAFTSWTWSRPTLGD